MNSEEILKKLVREINKEDAKRLETDEERTNYWTKKFASKEALNWSDKILDLESQYLKSCFVKKKLYNCYDIKSLYSIDCDNDDLVIIWDDNISSMVVDAIVVPASFDIADSKVKDLHSIYYTNGVKLRKKILTIMNGDKLPKDEVLITRSYGILADYIIHVNYDDIKKSTLNILECSRVNMIKTLVICLNDNVDDIMIVYKTILEYLEKYRDYFDKIILSIKDNDVRDKFVQSINDQ